MLFRSIFSKLGTKKISNEDVLFSKEDLVLMQNLVGRDLHLQLIDAELNEIPNCQIEQPDDHPVVRKFQHSLDMQKKIKSALRSLGSVSPSH